MTGWMPGASRAQDFSRAFTSSRMTPRLVVLHTTEGPNWPGYGGGGSAPHFTIDSRLGEIRQHFPVTSSARALENRPGGVETNTAGAVQIELIGTCDPAARRGWAARSVFWPEADANDLAELLRVLRWLERAHGVPIRDAAPRGWFAYGIDDRRPGVTPASYGASPARMSGDEWNKARGIVGHQHVPENSHGDPGNFPIRLITNPEDTMPSAKEIFDAVWHGGKLSAISPREDYGRPAESPARRLVAAADRAGRAMVIGRRNAADIAGLKAAVKALGKAQGLDPAVVEKIVADAAKDALRDVSITLSVDSESTDR